jgi:predicted TIM-barrel fold metal-dependent hydrolase
MAGSITMDRDRAFYDSELDPFLPAAVLDFHTHVWDRRNPAAEPWEETRPGASYMVTERSYPPEQLLADGRAAFPDREYRAVCFGDPTPSADNAKDTAYVAAAGIRRGLYPLMVAGSPLGVPREILRERVERNGFLGFKVHLDWQGDDYGDRTIEGMLGANEMDLADELALVVLLHVPRAGRLAEPVVQRGVRWLASRWPRARIVLAHCGRCYLPAEMERAVNAIRDLPNVWLDTSMVMEEGVLAVLFGAIDSSRVVYATDFPVAAMRGRRVRVMDHWVDVVQGDYPDSAYRVKAQGIRVTMMAREIALAVRDGARRAGIGAEALRGVFFDNGMKVLSGVRGGEAVRAAEARWRS